MSPIRLPIWAAYLSACGVFVGIIYFLMFDHLVFGALLPLDDIFTSDLINANAPLRHFLGDTLSRGEFPVWIEGLYNGIPMLAQGEAAPLNPIAWLLFVGLHWIDAVNWSIAIHMFIAAMGMYILMRYLGINEWAALCAGVAFMLCGFLIGHIKHLNMHHAACWIPLLLWSVDKFIRRPTLLAALILACVASLQITEGHPQITYISGYIIALLILIRIPWRFFRFGWDKGYTIRLILFGILALLVCGIITYPYLLETVDVILQGARDSQSEDAWKFATYFEYKITNLLTTALPYIWGDAANATYDPAHGIFWESWSYSGLVMSVMGIFGLWVLIFRRKALKINSLTLWTVLFSGILAVCLMPGSHSWVYHIAFEVIPGLDWFRFHHRFIVTFTLSVILIGAIGLHLLFCYSGRLTRNPFVRALPYLAVSAIILEMVIVVDQQFPAIDRAYAAKTPEVVTQIQNGRNITGFPTKVFSPASPDGHVDAFYEAKGWSANLTTYVDQWNSLQPNINLFWSIHSVNGYVSLLPDFITKVFSSQSKIGEVNSGRTHRRVLAGVCGSGEKPTRGSRCKYKIKCKDNFATSFGVFGVSYFVSPHEFETCPGTREIGKLSSGIHTTWIYENQRVMPPSFTVSSPIFVQSQSAAIEELLESSFDPLNSVIIETVIDPEWNRTSANGERENLTNLIHTQILNGRFKIEGLTGYSGWVFCSTTYSPKWRLVDNLGRRIPYFRANGAGIAMRVDGQSASIELEYYPELRVLLWASFLVWILLFIALAAAGVVLTLKSIRSTRHVRSNVPSR